MAESGSISQSVNRPHRQQPYPNRRPSVQSVPTGTTTPGPSHGVTILGARYRRTVLQMNVGNRKHEKRTRELGAAGANEGYGQPPSEVEPLIHPSESDGDNTSTDDEELLVYVDEATMLERRLDRIRDSLSAIRHDDLLLQEVERALESIIKRANNHVESKDKE